MYYPNPLDVNSPEYAQVLRDQHQHDVSGLSLYVSYLYQFALNRYGHLYDGAFEAPQYKTLALRHGGTVAVYIECIRQNRFYEYILGTKYGLRIMYGSDTALDDPRYDWVSLDDIAPDDIDDSNDSYDEDDIDTYCYIRTPYPVLEARVMDEYRGLLISKQLSEPEALAYGIPNTPIHPTIQAVIDRALTNPEYADFRDVLDGKKKFLTAEQMDYKRSDMRLFYQHQSQ